MAEEYITSSGDDVADVLTRFGKSIRSSGSNQLYTCVDMAVHQDPRKTISKEDLMQIARDCNQNISVSNFTEFKYGFAYSPEFVKQVEEALRYRAEQLAEEKEDLERARRAVELGEKSVKETEAKLEKMRQSAKAAGLKEVF